MPCPRQLPKRLKDSAERAMSCQKLCSAVRAPSRPCSKPYASTAAFIAPALVPSKDSCPSSSRRSSTPHAKAPREPPPCRARATGLAAAWSRRLPTALRDAFLLVAPMVVSAWRRLVLWARLVVIMYTLALAIVGFTHCVGSQRAYSSVFDRESD